MYEGEDKLVPKQHLSHPTQPKAIQHESEIKVELRRWIYYCYKHIIQSSHLYTWTLGSLPRRKLLIVPNSPSCQIGKASFSTLVRFNCSKWACETSIFARIASRSSYRTYYQVEYYFINSAKKEIERKKATINRSKIN